MALGIELNQLSALESSDGAESDFEIDVSYLFIYVFSTMPDCICTNFVEVLGSQSPTSVLRHF